MRNSFNLLSFLFVSNFSLHLIISLGLLLTLPKDSADVDDVKENSQKAEIKIQIKSFFKKQSWMAKRSSVIQLKPSFSKIISPVKLILICKMFKLQYYLLILTFSRVYKNQKGHYQNYLGAFAPQWRRPCRLNSKLASATNTQIGSS